MSRWRDRERFLTVRTAYIWSALIGLLGVVLVVVYDDRTGSGARAVALLGQALFSAGVVAVVYGWISAEENEVRIARIVERRLTEALRPVAARAFEGALKDRTWRCHLEAPRDEDQLSDYLHQSIMVSYVTPECTEELRFIGIAGASPDWSAYMGDEYLFRWEFDVDLNLTDSAVFEIRDVRIDGRELSARRTVDGTNTREYRYRVPKALVGSEARVSFAASVRKYVGTDERIAVITKVFSNVAGAEFLLSVGPSVGATHISSSCDGVTALVGSRPEYEMDDTLDPRGMPISQNVRVLSPIQRDSQVSFEVRRSGAQ